MRRGHRGLLPGPGVPLTPPPGARLITLIVEQMKKFHCLLCELEKLLGQEI